MIAGECSKSCLNRVDNIPCYGRGMIYNVPTNPNKYYAKCTLCGWVTPLVDDKPSAKSEWDKHLDGWINRLMLVTVIRD